MLLLCFPFDCCVILLLSAARAVHVLVCISVPVHARPYHDRTVRHVLRVFPPMPLSHSGPLQPLGAPGCPSVLSHVLAGLPAISGWLKRGRGSKGIVENRSATLIYMILP